MAVAEYCMRVVAQQRELATQFGTSHTTSHGTQFKRVGIYFEEGSPGKARPAFVLQYRASGLVDAEDGIGSDHVPRLRHKKRFYISDYLVPNICVAEAEQRALHAAIAEQERLWADDHGLITVGPGNGFAVDDPYIWFDSRQDEHGRGRWRVRIVQDSQVYERGHFVPNSESEADVRQAYLLAVQERDQLLSDIAAGVARPNRMRPKPQKRPASSKRPAAKRPRRSKRGTRAGVRVQSGRSSDVA